jgi:hypothetical protein
MCFEVEMRYPVAVLKHGFAKCICLMLVTGVFSPFSMNFSLDRLAPEPLFDFQRKRWPHCIAASISNLIMKTIANVFNDIVIVPAGREKPFPPIT